MKVRLIMVISLIVLLGGCSPSEDVTVVELSEEEIRAVEREIDEALQEPMMPEKPLPTDKINEAIRDNVMGDMPRVMMHPNMSLIGKMPDRNNQVAPDKAYRIIRHSEIDSFNNELDESNYDIVFLPLLEGLKQYNKSDEQLELLAFTTMNPYMIFGQGNDLIRFDRMADKRLTIVGKNTLKEVVFKQLLLEHSVDIESLTIRYVDSIETLFQEEDFLGSDDLILADAMALNTLKEKNYRLKMDLLRQWKMTYKDHYLITGVILAKKTFISSNSMKIEQFTANYQENDAVWTILKPEAHQGDLSHLLEIVLEIAPDLIGGEMPDERFFNGYNE